MSGAEATATTTTSSTSGDGPGMVPVQLAALVPSYDPAKDDITIFQQKVELLVETWPSNRMIELATRLVLNTSGTAFQKLQLHQKDIIINDRKGVQKLIELLGGSWGRIPLEKKFEAAERAIYRCQQKGDEANDSYLARAEVLWQELLSKGMQLSELQAYIVLRGSLLGPEDKKKVILDSNVGDSGTLKMEKVQSAIRLLGAGFFQEMTSGKKYGGGKYKTYDNSALMIDEEDDDWAQHVGDGAIDEDEAIEQMIQEGDEDAMMVSEFETAAQEVLQDDPNLSSAYSAYTEARRKLSEKVRFRGFFPVSKGKGKPGGKGGKGKGSKNSFFQRKPLNQRILRSQCRRCLQFGHWKDECPLLKSGDGASSSSATTVGGPVTSGSFAGTTIIQTPESLPLEFLNLQEFASVGLDDMEIDKEPKDDHVVFANSLIDNPNYSGSCLVEKKHPQKSSHLRVSEALCRLRSRSNSRLGDVSQNRVSEHVVSVTSHHEATAFISSSGLSPNHGILDTGATKTVIGSDLVKDLLNSLDPVVRKKVSRCPCQVTFRFGNLSTLQSQQALVIPIGNLNLKVAVVPGLTPFLLSNTLMRALKAKIDTHKHLLDSPFLQRPVPLMLTQKGLYLLDVNLLAKLAEAVDSTPYRESFVTFDEKSPSKSDAEAETSISTSDAVKSLEVGTVDKSLIKVNRNPKFIDSLSKVDITPSNTISTSCSEKDFYSKDRSCDSLASNVDCRSNAQLSRSSEEGASGIRRGARGPDSVLIQGVRGDDCQVRQHPQGKNIPGSLGEPSGLDQLVRQPLREESEEGAPSHDSIHRTESREMRTGRNNGGQDGWIPTESKVEPGGEEEHGLCSTQAQGEAFVQSDARVTGGRDRGVMGRAGDGAQHPGIRESGSDQRDAKPDAQHGERHPEHPRIHPGPECEWKQSTELMPASVERYWLSAGDHDDDERCYMKSDEERSVQEGNMEKNRFRRLLGMYTEELQDCQKQYQGAKRGSTLLFEVFCSDHSQLTHQCQQMSCRAERFGYAQGDLHTVEGRSKLFQSLVIQQPRNLWYSPMCGPWCAFSSLNASKSAEAYADIHAHRLHHIADLALGVVLLRYQTSIGNHFHWEQPSRSLMFRNPLLKEVFHKTQCAQFDLCRLGNLQDPENHKRIKKGLEVLTTSSKLFKALHGNVCSGNHEHQVIEGSTKVGGISIARSKFSEDYPRKFARYVASVLRRDFSRSNDKMSECFALLESSRQLKCRRMNSEAAAKVPSASSTENLPEPKRRRLLEKQIVTPVQEEWKSLFEDVSKRVPRVGKIHINDSFVIDRIQALMPEKKIQFLVGCRGTDRALGPIHSIATGEAPFRKCLFSHRLSGDIMLDDNWERWDQLSKARIQRKNHPCRVNITLFAGNPDKTEMQMESSGQSPTAQSTQAVREPSTISDNQGDITEMDQNIIDRHLPESSIIDLSSNNHGASFRQLSVHDRQLIVKAHKNLGHPSNDRLAMLLKQQGASPEVIEGVHSFQCSVCSMQSPPKHSRPATIKDDLDFNDRIAIDGLKFVNSQGQSFHLYHCIDMSTSFQTAIIAPNRSAEHAIQCLVQMWLCWAGPPSEIIMDSATEFTSDLFQNFLQAHNIKSRTIAPGAHWQNGRCERHGQVLERILKKVDSEHPIATYDELQKVLWHATQAKNACSLRKGFSPEILVFGRASRLPGSICGDEQLPSHELADSEHAAGLAFRHQLALRESARKAFHEADNQAALRRALLRRSCPTRGVYQKGEWVMIWKTSGMNQGWFGPMQVVNQDGPHCVWVTQGNNLLRCAPEHCRPVNALEAHRLPGSVDTERLDHLRNQVTDERNRNPGNTPLNSPEIVPSPVNENVVPENQNIVNSNSGSHPGSEGQPDQEPEVSSNSGPSVIDADTEHQTIDGVEVPIPTDNSEDESLMCVGWRSIEEQIVSSPTSPNQAWRMEILIGDKEIREWKAEEEPSDMAFVVTAGKKQRSEVRLTDLKPEEVEEFQQAKASEVNNWLKTGTVVKMLRNQLPAEEILRCRWVLTWKPIEMSDRDPSDPNRSAKAKARLVVLGYLDPHLEELSRDSPTLGRHSRMLLLQMIASYGWDLRSFDIKAAFLQGQPQDNRLIGLEPCPELIKAMSLAPGEICRLVKSAYGLIDAPYLWYKTLSSALLKLNFEQSPFDPCVFLLRHPETKRPRGIIGIHVDDGLCGGDEVFIKKLHALREQYPFGSEKVGSFTFTGIQLRQRSDKAITLSQSEYVKNIKPISIDVNRRSTPNEMATESERQDLRALIGSLQYAAVNTRPDLASRLSMLQSKVNQAKIETLIEANRVLHGGKRHHDVSLCMQPIAPSDFRFLAFSDASFASKSNPDSHAGSIILGTHKDISTNVSCCISPISWGCKKIQKVVTSTLSAETMSLASTLDQLSWLKLYWAWFQDPEVNWRNPNESLPKLPKAFSSSTYKIPEDHQDVAATDCKSLYDLVSRTAAPNCQEYRTQLQARAIKDFLSEGTVLRWVHSGAQLADCLTKIMESSFLRETLKVGQYRLHDESEILKQRANNRSRLQWLRNGNDPEKFTNSTSPEILERKE